MSDVQIILKYDVFLDQTVTPISLPDPIYAGDAGAQRIMFRIFRRHGDSVPIDLRGYYITAHFVRPDDGDVVITGVTGSAWSYVDLPAACYVYPGKFSMLIRVVDDETLTSTIRINGRVEKATSDTIIDPGTNVGSLDRVLHELDDIEAAAAAALEAAAAADAAAKGEVEIDITEYPTINCTISSTNKATRDRTQYVSAQIPTDGFGAVSFTANSERAGVISILKTAIPDDIANQADLTGYLATGETGRHLVEAGESETIILPEDARYLFISRVSNGTETIPGNITAYSKMVSDLAEVKADVQNVYTEFAPAFDPTATYQMGNPVSRQGGFYIAVEPVTGAWDGTKWMDVTAQEIVKYSLWNVEPSIEVYDVINASTGNWYSSGKYRGTITRIAGADRIRIKAGGKDCYYALLKSGFVIADGAPYYATGFTGAIIIAAGTEATVAVPEDAQYLYMLAKNTLGANMLPARVLAYGEKPERILDGLNVSVIGDSISAFTGTIPSGNLAYYTRSNAGVRVPTEMWWYHVSEITGGKLLINDSWSGSPVTDVRSATHTGMADVSRCQNLHSWEFGDSEDYDLEVTAENIGALRQSPFRKYAKEYEVGDYLKKVVPDVIFVAGGGNDYNREAGLGTWDGHTTLDTTEEHTFREAYANMINRMHAAYPDALIVCLKPWYWRQPVNVKEQAILNDDDMTYKDYWDAIVEIADLMSCPVIDGITMGFNPWNYYPTFCVDSEEHPVHPNALGQKIMGETVAEAMKRVCVGYVSWLKANN